MKCSYCGSEMTKGTGLLFVKRDGTLIYLCSNKCRKNFEMGRKPEKRKWTNKKIKTVKKEKK